MKVLVIQTAFLGDVVLSTALLNALQQHPSPIETDVLVRKGNESLLNHFPSLRKVIVWDKKSGKYSALLKLMRTIRRERYDAVINLQRFGATGLLTAFSGARYRIGYEKNPFSFLFSHRVPHRIGGPEQSHEIERNDQLLASLGIKGGYKPVLYPSAADHETVKPYIHESFFCIAPTSVWFTKQVPEQKWLELIAGLRQSFPASPVYLLGGPGDLKACESIALHAGKGTVQVLAGKLSLLQTAALMKKARMNYVNDSAPLHLASAMNAPVRAFFCSTIPAFGFGPLSTDRGIREVMGLACRPCGLHGHKACPEGHFRCAIELDMKI